MVVVETSLAEELFKEPQRAILLIKIMLLKLVFEHKRSIKFNKLNELSMKLQNIERANPEVTAFTYYSYIAIPDT